MSFSSSEDGGLEALRAVRDTCFEFGLTGDLSSGAIDGWVWFRISFDLSLVKFLSTSRGIYFDRNYAEREGEKRE